MNVAQMLKTISCRMCVAALAFAAPSVLDFVSSDAQLSVTFSSSAQAQANKKKKTRSLPGIGPKIMKQLGVVTEFVSPDTEKNPDQKPDYTKALAELDKMKKNCKGKCNKYELGQMYRFYAFAYYSMDNYAKAIDSYKSVIAQSPEIPIAVELDALNSLTQLSYAQDNYDDALTYLKRWMDLSTIVGADKYFMYASICYSKGDKTCALKNVDQSIKMIEDKGKMAKEQWYGLQLAIHLEKESYKASKPILEKLIRHYPKIKYWTQFANVNGLMERDRDQLASLDTVAIQNKLEKRQDIVNLSYLYLGADAPYLAAKNLEKGMKSKKVERNVKYLKILASSWRASGESKKAIEVLKEAAVIAKKEDAANKDKKKYKPEEGNIYAELVGLYSDIDDSKSAIEAGKSAISAGNLKRACEVHTNMGISYVDLNQYKSAISAFEKASDDKQCRALVNNWIRYAQNEQRKKEELAKAI